MSEVFISYAHSTARQARGAAEALRAAGYSVWLDEDLPAHRAFSPEIEAQLTAAKAALVIWSAEAAKSHWVLSEANRAREADKLVQLTIDGAGLPMPFDQIQCADLSGWSGEGQHPAWSKVAASVADLVKGGARRSAAMAHPPTAAPAHEPLLAVLAFDNLSGDPEMAYFSDGVSEEILQTVARGADLKVIGRTSSFQFRGADKAVRKVVADLNATHILDGSVRRSGSHVRIAANLIECERQTTLWSDRFDRDLSDVFALQDEIAAAVAAALKTMFARSGPAQSIDPEAYDLFLRAQALGGSTLESAIRRIALLREVVGLAPTFARGWATLAAASAYTLRRVGRDAHRRGLTREQVVEAAETALRLDGAMGLAYQALALLEPFGRYRALEALNSQALAVAPNDPDVLARTATAMLSTVGRLREGLDCARRAYVLDPLQPDVANAYGGLLNMTGHWEEAGAIYESAVARWPQIGALTLNLINNAALRRDWGRVDTLIAAARPPIATGEAFARVVRFVRNLRSADPNDVQLWVEEQRRVLSETGTVSLLELRLFSVLGLVDEAFELVEKASYAHMFDPAGPLPAGNTTPGGIFSASNRAMIDDPRFVRLCAKLGHCDYWIETGRWPDCADEVPYDFRAEARKVAAEGLARHG